jgi:hypothetical protein
LRKFKGTGFTKILKEGDIAVISSAYFEQCWQRGERFEDRGNIPAKFFIKGSDLMKRWKKHGFHFLVVISYGWLSKEHPDPDLFHLKRLVRIFKEIKARARDKFDYDGELGIILDFCSLWQETKMKKRTEEQFWSFKRGLQMINLPYCHRDVTAVKLTAVPDGELRGYHDRGWCFFECSVIDGKEASPMEIWGEYNIITCGDDFDPDKETATGNDFVKKFANAMRKPLLRPEDFERELELLRAAAKAKNVNLFTSGKDCDFVIQKYKDCFNDLASPEKLDYTGMGWGNDEVAQLGKALAGNTSLKELGLGNNNITDVSPLAQALAGNTSLKELSLNSNNISDVSPLAQALKGKPELEKVVLYGNPITNIEMLKEALPDVNIF